MTNVRTRGFTPPGILFFGRSSERSCAPPIPGACDKSRPVDAKRRVGALMSRKIG
jgi:hypothetical protein